MAFRILLSSLYVPYTTKPLTDPTNGSIVKNPDNTFTYTANPGYSGIDSFTYEICTADSTLCSSATVTIIVMDLPVANDDSDTTYIDVPVTIPVLPNDTGDYFYFIHNICSNNNITFGCFSFPPKNS